MKEIKKIHAFFLCTYLDTSAENCGYVSVRNVLFRPDDPQIIYLYNGSASVLEALITGDTIRSFESKDGLNVSIRTVVDNTTCGVMSFTQHIRPEHSSQIQAVINLYHFLCDVDYFLVNISGVYRDGGSSTIISEFLCVIVNRSKDVVYN